MAEVYRAKDTRLNRDVAIKVSAEQFTEVTAQLSRMQILAILQILWPLPDARGSILTLNRTPQKPSTSSSGLFALSEPHDRRQKPRTQQAERARFRHIRLIRSLIQKNGALG